jgi:hypothetical protein
VKNSRIIAGLLSVSCLWTASAAADPAIMSGQFDRNTPIVEDLLVPQDRCTDDDKFYDVIGPVQVSVSGEYIYQDASIAYGYDISASIHTPSFDPANPTANRIESWDDHGHIDLTAGTDYYIVVQPLCENREGAWALTVYEGPGTLTGDTAFTAPAEWFGTFNGTEPLAQTHTLNFCEDAYYVVSDTIQVDVTGTHYFGDVTSYDYGFQTQIAVYEGSFDSSNPAANRVDWVAGGGPIDLEAGTDYVIVTQSFCEPVVGSWLWVLAPPAPFEINPGLNGAYVNPNTPGQGFLLDVLPDFGLFFYAEFTYDTQQPNGMGNMGEIGAPGNRWYTAQGLYSLGDTSVEIPIYTSSGGLFNDPTAVNTEAAGMLELDFSDGCNGGMRTYSFDSGVSGSNPFQRLAPDNLELCEQQYEGPGVIVSPQ